MFGFIARTLGRRPKTTIVRERKPHVSEFYVGQYMNRIEEVARYIAEIKMFRVYVRFNPDAKCVDLHTYGGEILATIQVHGSECVPYRAIVCTSLEPELHYIFMHALGGLQVTFEPLRAQAA